jgi:hypothetical protein
MPKPRFVVTCPNGHTEGLLIRCVVDFPAIPSADGRTVLADESKAEIQEIGGTPGVDGGIWCPTCEEWSDEGDAVRPASFRRRRSTG